MDESEFLVDSMYEMDAPRCVDFNLTDVSVNESLFDKKTVGENNTIALVSQMDKLVFRSPGNAFRDIGNITPRIMRSSSKSKNSPLVSLTNTPVNASPLLLDSSRRVTRSISKSSMDTTLTPSQPQPSPAKSPAEIMDEKLGDEPYPQPKTYPIRRLSVSSPSVEKSFTELSTNAAKTTNNSPISTTNKKTAGYMRSTRASTGNLQQKTKPDLKGVRRSVGAKQSPTKTHRAMRKSTGSSPTQKHKQRMSTATRPLRAAHSGTPFTGKESPLRSLRTRTKSQNSSNMPNDSTKKVNTSGIPSNSSIRQRTSSAGASVAVLTSCSNSTPSLRARAVSQSSLPSNADSTSHSLRNNMDKIVSPSLTRLMRPTAAVKAKMHDNPLSKRRHSEQDDSKPPKQPRNTIPRTPNFMRTKTRLTPAKSTEDLQMEKIIREKEEMASLKKQNEVGLRSIASGNSSRKEKRPPSLPSGTSASKLHSMNTRADIQVKAKRSIYDKMSTKTRSTPALTERASTSRHDVYTKPAATIPHSPKLQTKSRDRPPRIPNSQQREELELEKMKQQQFKAMPLDKKIFEGGALGVKQKEHISLTEPLPIKFATDIRMAKHAEKQPSIKEDKPVIKAQPAPKVGPVFQPKLAHRCTTVTPFTFESKDEQIKRKRAELRQKYEEEERKLREFKANPLPPSPSPLPQKQVLPATVPEPFNLRIDQRGQTQQERLKQKIEEEHIRMLEAAVVHAKPADVLKKQPFVPKKEPPKITEPLNVELSSAKRAEERKEYELRKREYQVEADKLEAELRRRQEEEEHQELIRRRQETVIKPAPIKHYRPLQIKQSEKPLTQPKSPAFSKR